MAALYIHIPFCKSRCIYCGFYSTTMDHLMQPYIEAVLREARSVSSHGNGLFTHTAIETVYLGGGTPSQLKPELLKRLFDGLDAHFSISPTAEITMECNPDDLTDDYMAALRDLPVNRISMGAQTFQDERLRFLHRRHSSQQVFQAVERLRKAGFSNISIDLMFGFPGETMADWEADISAALRLNVEHLSAYSLMYEEGTVLYERMKNGNVPTGTNEVEQVVPIDEELELRMYQRLIDRLTASGYEHYEISNFAKSKVSSFKFQDSSSKLQGASCKGQVSSFRSRHNSSYWDGTPYLGLGAAAHSFDIDSRWWNISDVREYIRRVEQGESPVEEREMLTIPLRYNDMVTTALRTREGLSCHRLESLFGQEMKQFLMANARPHLQTGRLLLEGDRLHLSRQGLFVSDSIMSDLMFV